MLAAMKGRDCTVYTIMYIKHVLVVYMSYFQRIQNFALYIEQTVSSCDAHGYVHISMNNNYLGLFVHCILDYFFLEKGR